MESAARASRGGGDRHAPRNDVAAVAHRARGRASALDALDHGGPAGPGEERRGAAVHYRRQPGLPAAARPPAWLLEAARDTNTITAELRLVPNQPVVFTDDPAKKPRSEDDFIAYTWDKFLRTGDEKWPARLPMTKSAVRAMDAVTAFAAAPEGGAGRRRLDGLRRAEEDQGERAGRRRSPRRRGPPS